MNQKIWMPKEIRQKEMVWGHILGRPITSRHLIFMGVGVLVGLVVFMLSLPVEKGPGFLEGIIARVALFLFFPLLGLLMCFPDKQGQYLEEKAFRTIKYKKNAGTILNDKALRAILHNKRK